MIAWLAGTRVGRLLSAVVAGAGVILGAYLLGRREGSQQAAERAREADRENADRIEGRADEAIRKHNADRRDVDERLRSKGRLRD